jgi:hypothetical protein
MTGTVPVPLRGKVAAATTVYGYSGTGYRCSFQQCYPQSYQHSEKWVSQIPGLRLELLTMLQSVAVSTEQLTLAEFLLYLIPLHIKQLRSSCCLIIWVGMMEIIHNKGISLATALAIVSIKLEISLDVLFSQFRGCFAAAGIATGSSKPGLTGAAPILFRLPLLTRYTATTKECSLSFSLACLTIFFHRNNLPVVILYHTKASCVLKYRRFGPSELQYLQLRKI